MRRYFWVAEVSLGRFTQIESEAIDVGGAIDAFKVQMTALLLDQMATQGEAHIGADSALCLVIIDPVGTNSRSKREGTMKRGSNA